MSKPDFVKGSNRQAIGNSIKELTLPLLLTRFSALLKLSLLRCRKASQAGVPGEVNCGAAFLVLYVTRVRLFLGMWI